MMVININKLIEKNIQIRMIRASSSLTALAGLN